MGQIAGTEFFSKREQALLPISLLLSHPGGKKGYLNASYCPVSFSSWLLSQGTVRGFHLRVSELTEMNSCLSRSENREEKLALRTIWTLWKLDFLCL